MKRTEVLTALMMVLIPLSFLLWIEALHQTDGIAVELALIGIIPFLTSILLWLYVQSRLRKEESEEQQKRAREIGDMQTLIREMKGLRQDIIRFLKK